MKMAAAHIEKKIIRAKMLKRAYTHKHSNRNGRSDKQSDRSWIDETWR